MANNQEMNVDITADISQLRSSFEQASRLFSQMSSNFTGSSNQMQQSMRSAEQNIQRSISSIDPNWGNVLDPSQFSQITNSMQQDFRSAVLTLPQNMSRAGEQIVNEMNAINPNWLTILNTPQMTTASNNIGQSMTQAQQDIINDLNRINPDWANILNTPQMQAQAANIQQEAQSTGDRAGSGLAEGISSGAEKASGAFKALGGAIAGFATASAAAIAAVGTSVAGIGAIVGKVTDEFQQGTGKIAAMTGKQGEELQKLKNVVKEVYSEAWGESIEDVSNATGTLQRNLGDRWKGMEKQGTEAAFIIRDTFDVEMNETGRAVSSMMDNFHMDNAVEAMDILHGVMQRAKGDTGEIADSFWEYSVQANKLGYSAQEFGTALVNASNAGGWSIDKLGDGMKEFALRVGSVSKTTTDAFSGLGLNADEMYKKFGKGGDTAQEAMDTVVKKLMEVKSPIDQTTYMTSLFGTQFEDLGIKAVEALNMAGKETINFSGTTKKAGDDLSNNLGNKIETIKRAIITGFDNENSPMYQEMLKWSNWAIQNIPVIIAGINTFVQNMTAMQQTVKDNVLTPLLSGFMQNKDGIIGTFTDIYNKTAPIFQGIFEAIRPTLEQISLLITNVIGVLKVIWDNWGDEIMVVVKAAFEFAKGIIDAALKVINGVLGIFIGLFTGNWTKMKESIKLIWSGLWEAVKTVFGTAWNLLVGLIATGAKTAVNIIANFAKTAIDAYQNVKDKVVSIFSSLKDKVVGYLNGLGTDVGKAFSQMYEDFKSLGKHMIDGVWEGIKSKGASISRNIKDFFSNLVKDAESVLTIKSPSRVFRDRIGKNIGAGVIVGINATKSEASSTIKGYMTSMINPAKEGMENLQNSLSGGVMVPVLSDTASLSSSLNKAQAQAEYSARMDSNKSINVNVNVNSDMPLVVKQVETAITENLNAKIGGRVF